MRIHQPAKNRLRGFTLMELMIVVAIIGIIAAFAFPSYVQSIRKTDRSDATAALNQFAQILERCYTQNFTYLGCPNATPAPSPATTQKGYYTISVAAPAPTTTSYTLTATAIATQPQANDTGCTVLTLNNAGVQTPAACWQN